MPGGYAPKVEERSQIEKHLLTDGAMGEIPDWYRTIKAAQVLQVAPWELAERPLVWQEWALNAAKAESFVQEERAKRSAGKSKAKGK